MLGTTLLFKLVTKAAMNLYENHDLRSWLVGLLITEFLTEVYRVVLNTHFRPHTLTPVWMCKIDSCLLRCLPYQLYKMTISWAAPRFAKNIHQRILNWQYVWTDDRRILLKYIILWSNQKNLYILLTLPVIIYSPKHCFAMWVSGKLHLTK